MAENLRFKTDSGSWGWENKEENCRDNKDSDKSQDQERAKRRKIKQDIPVERSYNIKADKESDVYEQLRMIGQVMLPQ